MEPLFEVYQVRDTHRCAGRFDALVLNGRSALVFNFRPILQDLKN